MFGMSCFEELVLRFQVRLCYCNYGLIIIKTDPKTQVWPQFLIKMAEALKKGLFSLSLNISMAPIPTPLIPRTQNNESFDYIFIRGFETTIVLQLSSLKRHFYTITQKSDLFTKHFCIAVKITTFLDKIELYFG